MANTWSAGRGELLCVGGVWCISTAVPLLPPAGPPDQKQRKTIAKRLSRENQAKDLWRGEKARQHKAEVQMPPPCPVS